jgi:hypothetical protein
MLRSEDYPGQNYFHEHNGDIRRAEESFSCVPKLRYIDIRERPSDYYLRTGGIVLMRQWINREELEQMLKDSNGS